MYTRVAYRYASALFAEARQQGALDAVNKDVGYLLDQFVAHPSLERFLHNPTIGRGQKMKLFTDAFKTVLNPLAFNFLALLNAKGREGELRGALEAFREQYNELNGIVTVVVRSAVELSDAQKLAIKERVRKQTGKNSVVASYAIDANLIGGFTVQMGHQVLDASIKRQLERLRFQLNEGKQKLNGKAV